MHAFGPLENLRRLDGSDVLKGTVHLFGVLHHVLLIKVATVDGLQIAVNDPDGYFDQLQAAAMDNAGPFATVNVPGFPGDFAALICP